MDIEFIAKTCHETNKLYCESIGDDSQDHWDNSPDWQKESAIKGVEYRFNNPDSKPSDSHESWLKEKTETGWKYGEVKDVEKKEHPCFVPYDELPEAQKRKDDIFIAIVDALKYI